MRTFKGNQYMGQKSVGHKSQWGSLRELLIRSSDFPILSLMAFVGGTSIFVGIFQ